MNARQIIDLLHLKQHPNEGGSFIETYRCASSLAPRGYTGQRSLGTAIYYLITPQSFSALHRLPGDEIFHHYLGDDFKVECPTGSGNMATLKQVAEELSRRLSSIFLPNKGGARPCHGEISQYATDPPSPI